MSGQKESLVNGDLIRRLQGRLEALYAVSQVLSASLDVQETLNAMLAQLHAYAVMKRGMITLLDPQSGSLILCSLFTDDLTGPTEVSYRPGEGIVGAIIENGKPLVVDRLAHDPRFVDKLGLYDIALPFIAVPIVAAGTRVGVLAAQPEAAPRPLLDEQAKFMQMVANLAGQNVRLSWQVQNERLALTKERDRLQRVVKGKYGFANIVGHTTSMRRVFELVRQVAKWNTTVLIRGESGTGKELIANAIHYNSPRASGPFVKLNCAALPDTLLESELFGHEKGAFTGAVNQRKGRFEQAHGGTIFLDEVGEITPAFQAKLLRVLQEGEFERVGGSKTLKVDVRIIAATNKELEEAVAAGEFREDLFYRLNVMPINVPPLRERIEDIPELAEFLVQRIGEQQARPLEITDSAIRILLRHPWPGNVRELENTLERAAIMSEEGRIDRDVILLAGLSEDAPLREQAPLEPMLTPVTGDAALDEREQVIAALEQAGWVQAKAARLLGMTPRQIAYRIQILNIKMRRI